MLYIYKYLSVQKYFMSYSFLNYDTKTIHYIETDIAYKF